MEKDENIMTKRHNCYAAMADEAFIMEHSLNTLIDDMVGQAKLEANKLEKQLVADGRISVPQVLAQGEWSNSQGDEFVFAIILDMAESEWGKKHGLTSLQFITYYDEKFIISNYLSRFFGSFAKNVELDEFRSDTQKFIDRVTRDDGEMMKDLIANGGTAAIRSFIVPEKVQMKQLRLSLDCTLSVYGVVFDSYDAIKAYMRNQTDSSQPYIVEKHELFPCFDAEDYANENRFYRNFFFFRSKQDADKKALKIAHLQSNGNFCLANDSLPADMRPMVYYMDENTSMLLAY